MAVGPILIVLEATGGYELAVVAALVESQLPFETEPRTMATSSCTRSISCLSGT